MPIGFEFSSLEAGVNEKCSALIQRVQRAIESPPPELNSPSIPFYDQFADRARLAHILLIREGTSKAEELQQSVLEKSLSLVDRVERLAELWDLKEALLYYADMSHSTPLIDAAAMQDYREELRVAVLKELASSLCLSGDDTSLVFTLTAQYESLCECLLKLSSLPSACDDGWSPTPTANAEWLRKYVHTLRGELVDTLMKVVVSKKIEEIEVSDDDKVVSARLSTEPIDLGMGMSLFNAILSILPDQVVSLLADPAEDAVRLSAMGRLSAKVLEADYEPSKLNDVITAALRRWGLIVTSLILDLRAYLAHKYLSLLTEDSAPLAREVELTEDAWQCAASSAYLPPTAEASALVARLAALPAAHELPRCFVTHGALTLAIALSGLCGAVAASKELRAPYFDMIEIPVKLWLAALPQTRVSVADLVFLLSVLARQRVVAARGTKLVALVAATYKKKLGQLRVAIMTTLPTSFSAPAVLSALIDEQARLELEVCLMDHVASLQAIDADLAKLPAALHERLLEEVAARLRHELDEVLVASLRSLHAAAEPDAAARSAGLVKGFIQKLSETRGASRAALRGAPLDEALWSSVLSWVSSRSSGPEHYARSFEALMAHCSNLMSSAPASEMMPATLGQLAARTSGAARRALIASLIEKSAAASR